MYTAIVLVNNDALAAIEEDPRFGKKLAAAIREHAGRRAPIDVDAQGDHTFMTGATVVHQVHQSRRVCLVVHEGAAEIKQRSR